MTTSWQILINNFLGGFSPRYYNSGYPTYGNPNHAGQMLNVDITDPNGMTQGPALSTLTAGDQTGAVTALINSILEMAVTSNVTYGIGGTKLHKISSTAVTNSGIWPHTITGVTTPVGEDVCYYQGNLYYSYNSSSPTQGDIGLYDLVNTFTDQWGSAVPTGHAQLVGSVPHQMTVGSSDVMFFTNGRYVGSYNGTTYAPQQLPLPTNTVAVSIKWNSGKVYIAANIPNVLAANKNHASIYVWDGVQANWDTEIKVMGKIGGLHVKNGVVFFFYEDVSNIGGFKLAYLNGATVVDLANFSGGLPNYNQITDYKDYIIWNSSSLNALWSYTTFPWQLTSPWTATTGDDLIFAYGSGDVNLPVHLFQLADSGYTTAGALDCPFGTPMIASTDGGSNFKLAQFSGYDTNCNWKSLIFDLVSEGKITKLQQGKITFEQLANGARVDITIRNSNGKALYTDTISYARLGAVSKYEMFFNGIVLDNFRIEFDYSNGSSSNTVKLKAAKFYGINQ